MTVHAVVLIQCEIDSIPEAAQAIAEIEGVSEVYSVAGEVDLVAIVRVAEHDRLATVIPGGMRTSFFDGRPEQYRHAADADLSDPADVAEVVLRVLRHPATCQVRELVVTPAQEPSWP